MATLLPTAGEAESAYDLVPVIQSHPHRLVFLTLSGSHAYGLAEAGSDLDVRGMHTFPTSTLLGLPNYQETYVSFQERDQGAHIDLVTHDARKFIQLLLRRKVDVLEFLYSAPGTYLLPYSTTFYEELRSLVPHLATKEHYQSYQGYVRDELKRFGKKPSVKSLLNIYRRLLTGTYLLETGRLELNLWILKDHYRLTDVSSLILQKRGGQGDGLLTGVRLSVHQSMLALLGERLQTAYQDSRLPEYVSPETKAALSDLLLRIRKWGDAEA